MRISAVFSLTLAATIALMIACAPSASAVSAPHVSGELIVGYEDGAQTDQAEELAGVKNDPERVIPGVKLYQLGDSISVGEAADQVSELPGVAYAQPNLIRTASDVIPTDPKFQKEWALRNTGQLVAGSNGTPGADIGATEAWETQAGEGSVIVAVTDTGVDLTHEDLQGAFWANPGEIPANGIDDDLNGFTDDRRGWDFVSDDSNPVDQNGHGTHVAGIVGARAFNGLGVVGVAPEVTVMPVRVLDQSGSGTDADIARGFRYAANNGARVVSASLGGSGISQVIRDAVSENPNVLFVFAAGNESSDLTGAAYDPCTTPGQNVICVAATNSNDKLAGFSNRSASVVDLAAPGVNIISTYPQDQYSYKSGTSMATPMVSGAAAVLFSEDPGLTAQAARALILNDVTPLNSLSGETVTGGRLNLAASLYDLNGELTPPPTDLAPETSIISHPHKRTTSHRAVFRFASDHTDVEYRCQFDLGGWDECWQATEVSRVGVGRHRLLVAAVYNGVMDQSPAVFNWRVVRHGHRYRR